MSLQVPNKRVSMMKSMPSTKGPSVKSSKLNGHQGDPLSFSQPSSIMRPHSPSIEFQLSKKAAELTMIVQMLFTQLHTKEAECELLQRYYGEFCDALTQELAEERKTAIALQNKVNEQDTTIRLTTEEAQLRAKDVEKFKTDCAIAQERTQQYSNLYNATLAEKNSLFDEVTLLKNQLETQKEICTNLEVERSKASAQAKRVQNREIQNQAKTDKDMLKLQNENRDLNTELGHIKTYAEDMLAMKEKAEEEKRILQGTVDCLRADYLILKEKYDQQRAAPFVNPMTQLIKSAEEDEKERRRRIASARKNLRSAAISCNLLTGDEPSLDAELAQLRKELQRYKLELQNRDASFNRMFAAAASGRPNNNRNGNLITSVGDYEVPNSDSGFTNNDTVGQQSVVSTSSGTPSSNKRQINNTMTRRVPLMPAHFTSSTANSVRRSLVEQATANRTITNPVNPAAKLPPVDLNNGNNN